MSGAVEAVLLYAGLALARAFLVLIISSHEAGAYRPAHLIEAPFGVRTITFRLGDWIYRVALDRDKGLIALFWQCGRAVVARPNFPLSSAKQRNCCMVGLRGYLALSVMVYHVYAWVQTSTLGQPWSSPLNNFAPRIPGATNLL